MSCDSLMGQNEHANAKKPDENTNQRHFKVFDLLSVLIALAIGAFSADYAATKFGALASIAAFVIVSVLSFLVVGYAFHILRLFVSWFCRGGK